MTTLTNQALWNKSSVFINRGLKRLHNGDNEGFQLWSALSLELLGKAALAHIHPALVADPTHQASMFAACGRPFSTDLKTIQAKTLWERLQRISKSFDHDAVNFCNETSHRRNAELHSGELPFLSIQVDTWAPKFWRIATIIIEAQDRVLEDWVDEKEAASIRELVSNLITSLEQAVSGRIRRHAEKFETQFPSGSSARESIRELHKGGTLVSSGDFGTYHPDGMAPASCPSCGCDGLLAGEHASERITEVVHDEHWYSAFAFVNVTYSSEAFRCKACGLYLNGYEELSAAEIEDEFDLEEERAPEYGEDYGND